jgi:hypothetical protein
MKDRFAKLAALTRGAAVVTLGVGASIAVGACTKSDAPPAAAGTIQPDPATPEPVDAAAPVRRKYPMPNAMRPPGRFADGGAGPSDGGSNDGS